MKGGKLNLCRIIPASEDRNKDISRILHTLNVLNGINCLTELALGHKRKFTIINEKRSLENSIIKKSFRSSARQITIFDLIKYLKQAVQIEHYVFL